MSVQAADEKVFYCDYCGLVALRIVGNAACLDWFEEYFPGLIFTHLLDDRSVEYSLEYCGNIPEAVAIPSNAQVVHAFAGASYLTWHSAGTLYAYADRAQKRGAHLVTRAGPDVRVYVHTDVEHEEIVVRIARELILRHLLKAGFVPFHASAVVTTDGATVFLGPRNAGKTSSLFAFCTVGDGNPLASDIALMRTSGTEVEVVGWPVRVSYYPSTINPPAHAASNANTDGDIAKIRITPSAFARMVGRQWMWRAKLNGGLFVNCNRHRQIYEVDTLDPVAKEAIREHMFDDWQWGDVLQLGGGQPTLDNVFACMKVKVLNGNIRRYAVDQRLPRLVSQRYFDGRPLALNRLTTGESWNYEVVAEGGARYFVKVIDSTGGKEDGFREASTAQQVARCGIRVPAHVRATDGFYTTRFADFHLTVQAWVDGTTVVKHSANPSYLMAMAHTLGTCNVCLRSEKFPVRLLSLFTGSDRSISSTEQLISRATRDLNCAQRIDVIELLRHKIHLTRTLYELHFVDMSKLTFVNSHGDFSCMQTMARDGHLFHVIDWSRASCVPAVWEVMRSYCLSSKECAAGEVNEDLLARYISAYASHVPLTTYDVKAAKAVYAAQLLQSDFGFREYVLGDDARNLPYARWRVAFASSLLGKLAPKS